MRMKKLVFIGDSLTEWYGWQRRFPEYRVINLGISGERVEELLQRLPSIHVEVKDPDYIFLMTGINNIGSGAYEIIETYRKIVSNLRNQYKTATLVIQSILPITIEWIDISRINDANHQLKHIAIDFRAQYLDIHALFLDALGKPKSEYLQEDGVHLSGKGYEVWSNEVERFLEKEQPRMRLP